MIRFWIISQNFKVNEFVLNKNVVGAIMAPLPHLE